MFEATIHIPLAKNPLSLNARLHWRSKAALTKQWREFVHYSSLRFPHCEAVDVTLTWFVTDSIRRDEDNLYGLLKACCDGLVPHVTDDDTANYQSKTCRIVRAPAGTKTAYMELTIKERQP